MAEVRLRDLNPAVLDNELHVAGNIGIGTTQPTELLHVQSATNAQGGIKIDSRNTAAGNEATILLEHAGNNSYEIKGGSDLVFSSDAGTNERVRITTAGNVGIGTTAPSAKLNISNGSRVSPAAPNGNGDEFVIEGTATGTGMSILSDGDSSSYTGHIIFGRTGNSAEGWLQYTHNSDLFQVATRGVVRTTVDGSGNVGIGTTSPGNLLDIYNSSGYRTRFSGNIIQLTRNGTAYIDFGQDGAGGTLGALQFRVTDSSTLVMHLNNNGNVGIGTANPSNILHLRAATPQIYIQSDNGSDSSIVFGDASDASRGQIKYNSSDEMLFLTNNLVEAVRIDSSGNVGIGTTSPSEKLHVSGGDVHVEAGDAELRLIDTSSSRSWAIHASSASVFNINDITAGNLARLTINSSGNVGIGASSPTEKLHVAGNLLVTGDIKLGTSGTRIVRDGPYDKYTFWHWDGIKNRTTALQPTAQVYFADQTSPWTNSSVATKSADDILTVVGGAVKNTTYYSSTWHNSHNIGLSNTTNTPNQPSNYGVLTIPCDPNYHNVLHLKTGVADGGFVMLNAWVLNSSGVFQKKLQAHSNQGLGVHSWTNAPGPRNGEGRPHRHYEWQPITIPKTFASSYAYVDAASPTGYSIKISINRANGNGRDNMFIGGISISRNSSGFCHLSPRDIYHKTNGTNNDSSTLFNVPYWTDEWNSSSGFYFHPTANGYRVMLPIAGTDKDLIIGLAEHGNDWFGTAPSIIINHGGYTNRAHANTVYTAGALNAGSIADYMSRHRFNNTLGVIVPKEDVSASVQTNHHGALQIEILIDTADQGDTFHGFSLWTEQWD